MEMNPEVTTRLNAETIPFVARWNNKSAKDLFIELNRHTLKVIAKLEIKKKV